MSITYYRPCKGIVNSIYEKIKIEIKHINLLDNNYTLNYIQYTNSRSGNFIGPGGQIIYRKYSSLTTLYNDIVDSIYRKTELDPSSLQTFIPDTCFNRVIRQVYKEDYIILS